MAAQGETRSLESPPAGPGQTACETGLARAPAIARRFAPARLTALPLHRAGYGRDVRCTYRIEGPAAGEELRAGAALDAARQGPRGG